MHSSAFGRESNLNGEPELRHSVYEVQLPVLLIGVLHIFLQIEFLRQAMLLKGNKQAEEVD